jgi:serine/threonine protein kinase
MITWQPDDTILDYTLIRHLGTGGYGEVWEARKSAGELSRTYALKILDPKGTNAAQFQTETQLWGEATATPQDHIVGLHFAGPYQPSPHAPVYYILVSDFCPDGTLLDWLQQHGGKAPTWEIAVEMTLGILAGLRYLHERSRPILHRDLKPQNILMRGDTRYCQRARVVCPVHQHFRHSCLDAPGGP